MKGGRKEGEIFLGAYDGLQALQNKSINVFLHFMMRLSLREKCLHKVCTSKDCV